MNSLLRSKVTSTATSDAQPFNREDVPRQAGSRLSSQTLNGCIQLSRWLTLRSAASSIEPVERFGYSPRARRAYSVSWLAAVGALLVLPHATNGLP